ncbi:MAG TPA: hypothetical protein V6C85_15435 [Allocoleopsis sp.]
MSQPASNQDFQPLSTYTESSASNNTWVAVTLTKQDAEGNVTQVQTIVPKR